MGKTEYLADLKKKLNRLPSNEIDNALSYYEEYFNDAGTENEQAVIAQLGTPDNVAAKIIGEYAVGAGAKNNHGRLKNIWILIFAICASPIALPLILAVVIIALALIISLLSVFFSIGVTGIACVASGIASVIGGVYALFLHFPSGIFYIGFGLLSVSLGTALSLGVVKLSKVAFLGLQKALGKFLIRRSTK